MRYETIEGVPSLVPPHLHSHLTPLMSLLTPLSSMNLHLHPPRDTWQGILQRPTFETRQLEATVSDILKDIKIRGDEAVRDYTTKFDKVNLENFRVEKTEFDEARDLVSPELKTALRTAQSNITRFHEAQRMETQAIETMPGVRCWRKSVPIDKVGLYIPGGTAPLFSTVLMLGIPAAIAGCREVVLCTPPQADGKVNPVILYAAELVGIKSVFKIGGVQAVGAMAYGTASVPRVYKIFGPGNQYVTVAKQLVSRGGVSIDMPAGPSEVLVVADDTANPAYVAADLLSQAEHGIDSQVVLVCVNEKIATQVQTEINAQLSALPRADIARKALENSHAVIIQTDSEALDLINEYAPEHLIIATKNADNFSEKITNAGSVFIGNYTPEAVGDYASGTNHTLPTNGYATAYSGVSLDTFLKKITYQKLTKEGLENIGETVMQMAAAEQLEAHRNAVAIRLT